MGVSLGLGRVFVAVCGGSWWLAPNMCSAISVCSADRHDHAEVTLSGQRCRSGSLGKAFGDLFFWFTRDWIVLRGPLSVRHPLQPVQEGASSTTNAEPMPYGSQCISVSQVVTGLQVFAALTHSMFCQAAPSPPPPLCCL